jgi:hypothetical protein
MRRDASRRELFEIIVSLDGCSRWRWSRRRRTSAPP